MTHTIVYSFTCEWTCILIATNVVQCQWGVNRWAEPSWLQDRGRFGGYLKSEQWHPQTERRNYLKGYHFFHENGDVLVVAMQDCSLHCCWWKGRCPQNGETRMWQLAGRGWADYTYYQWTVIAMIHIVRVVGIYSRTYKSFTLKLGVFMIIWAIIPFMVLIFSFAIILTLFACLLEPLICQQKVNTCREVV